MNRDFWLLFTLFILAGAVWLAIVSYALDWLEDVVGGWWVRRQCRRFVAQVMAGRVWRHRDWQ